MAIRLTGLSSGLDTDSMVQELVSAYSTKLENYKKEKTKLEWKQDKWKDLNTKIYGFYTKSLYNLKTASAFVNKKKVTVSDTTKANVSASGNVANGTQTVEIKRLAKAAYLTSGKLVSAKEDGSAIGSSDKLSSLGLEGSGSFTVTVGGEEKTVAYSQDDTVSDFLSRVSEATGLKASFDASNQRIILNAGSGKSNDFNFKVEDESTLVALSKLGLATEDNYKDLGITAEEGTAYAAKQDGQNSIIVVNGATFENESNSVTVNGLTINATGETDGPISVTTETDTDGIYSMIKSFLSDYNSIINEMTKAYNADSAKGYDPLSDDEKDAMSDKEVETWENKIKDALLRRDDTLSSILNTMTSAMQKGFEINGKTYNLSTFGIQTQSIISATSNEHNAFHIDGDSEDSVSSDKKDKLRAAIQEDPEAVQSFFNQLAKNLYDSLTTKMRSTTLSSAYTIYNDKSMKSELSRLEDTIDDWEDRVSDYEETWYKKFSEMETALAKLESQTSSLTSLLGG